MDANKFMSEFSRMCDSYYRCSDCPLGEGKRICGFYPGRYAQEAISVVIKTVEEWSAAHSLKTRQSEFLKQWPEAHIRKDGYLDICPLEVSAAHRDADGDCVIHDRLCSDCCREFWMQEVE